jgi:hypothetical protein
MYGYISVRVQPRGRRGTRTDEARVHESEIDCVFGRVAFSAFEGSSFHNASSDLGSIFHIGEERDMSSGEMRRVVSVVGRVERHITSLHRVCKSL